MDKLVSETESRELIKELYDRGVSVKDVFGAFLELEEAGSARIMDVEDAVLAGYGGHGAQV